jgi:hypothetical protein
MTLESQKIEEILLVEQLRRRLGGVPPGQLEPADEPDVLFVVPGHRTGIEVTELHQRPKPGEGPRRAQESERLGIVLRARALAESSGMPVVDVAVHFNDSVRISKGDREALVNGLVDLVRDNVPVMGESVVLELWRQRGRSLPPTRMVRIWRAEVLTRHHWAVPDSGWVQMDFVAELQDAIDDKNARYATYVQHCEECWLLVTASGGRPSGLFEPSHTTKDHVYRSSFARTFFLEAFSGTLVELKTTTA